MENTNKKKILIVDDDKFLVNMYSIKFKAAGFDVCSAFDGQETLNKLKDGLVPDVVMLDMIMPSMDGVEILARIRKENLVPKAKVVILSNRAAVGSSGGAGYHGYIVKATTIPSEWCPRSQIPKVVAIRCKTSIKHNSNRCSPRSSPAHLTYFVGGRNPVIRIAGQLLPMVAVTPRDDKRFCLGVHKPGTQAAFWPITKWLPTTFR